jgi:phosphoserine phosphatase RsbU/P
MALETLADVVYRPSTGTVPRILVADDQPHILQALSLVLGEAGFETDTVASPQDVLEHVASRAYDLLLMDLNYTRDTTSAREGLGLLRDIQHRDPRLPVVVMTGWGTIDIAVEAMRNGAKSFIQKPWDDAALVEIVRREVAEGQIGRSHDARTRNDTQEAQRVQRALLPWTLPSIDGGALAAQWLPALGVGGDCYDVLRFSETRVGISIADVIGKGVPAALLMSNLQAAVRAYASSDVSPAQVCRSVNRLLHHNIAPGKFVTFCYALVDTAAQTVEFSNAGHNPPIVCHPDGRIDRLLPTGLVLGVDEDAAYAGGVVKLRPGDRLVWFTDGLIEARSRDNEDFSDERLVEFISTHRHLSATAMVDVLVRTARQWANDELEDDVTVMVMALDGA